MVKTRHNDRRCVGTGAALPPGEPAIRFVADPGGVLMPDLAEKLPGRGAWVAASKTALASALKKKAFSRSLKRAVSLPHDQPDEAFVSEVEQALQVRALQALGQARRAGSIITGFEKVKAAAPTLIGYLTPDDAAADGVRKIAAVVERSAVAPHIQMPVASDILSASLGGPGIVHVGVAGGPAGRAALKEVERWSNFHDHQRETAPSGE